MKIAYLDCTSGVSGDMFAGALIDAGVGLKYLEQELARLPVEGYSVRKRRVRRCGIGAVKFDVVVTGEGQRARKWSDIRRIIESSGLDADIKERGLRVFRRLFDAEARVHRRRPENVHLHELGAVDCMIDIISVLVGLKRLGVDRVYSSPVNLGSGDVSTAHGILPVPAPATLELLEGVPVFSSGHAHEKTTPTGAALIAELVDGFGDIPHMKMTGYGYGAGTRDIEGEPNAMRIILGQTLHGSPPEEVYLVEANMDDMNPQFYRQVMDHLMENGALDVFMTSIMMKKQRPGIKLSVITPEDRLDRMVDLILRETTSIGVRFAKWGRAVLERESVKLKTRFGQVVFKKVYDVDGIIRIYPEYEECRRIAEKKGLPVRQVHEELMAHAIRETADR